jgi:hypothetical protein
VQVGDAVGMLDLLGGGDAKPGIRAVASGIHQSGDWSYALGGGFLQPVARELHACIPTQRRWSLDLERRTG